MDDNASGRKSNMLNGHFEDIRNNLHANDGSSYDIVYKEPTAVMNDYTKNISSPIFTPGIYRQTSNLATKTNNFMNTDYRMMSLMQTPNKIRTPVTNEFEEV